MRAALRVTCPRRWAYRVCLHCLRVEGVWSMIGGSALWWASRIDMLYTAGQRVELESCGTSQSEVEGNPVVEAGTAAEIGLRVEVEDSIVTVVDRE